MLQKMEQNKLQSLFSYIEQSVRSHFNYFCICSAKQLQKYLRTVSWMWRYIWLPEWEEVGSSAELRMSKVELSVLSCRDTELKTVSSSKIPSRKKMAQQRGGTWRENQQRKTSTSQCIHGIVAAAHPSNTTFLWFIWIWNNVLPHRKGRNYMKK